MYVHVTISKTMTTKKILYVEDEPNLGIIVSETLQQKGFDVLLIKDGALVMDNFKKFVPDICILDVMLPNVDGFELGKQIRNLNKNMPIIFLTAKTQTHDVIEGFSAGGTDYIRKPFSIEELVARINNQFQLLNNQLPNSTGTITIGKYIFNPQKLELQLLETIHQLSNREAEVITVFSRHLNQTIDRKKLLLEVWGDDSFFNSRNLDVYISKLREYFSGDEGIKIITLKGKGYQFVVSGQG